MDQKKAVGKILLELINDGIIDKKNREPARMRLQWVYAAGFDEGTVQRGKRKPVLQMSTDGTRIRIHPSIKIAANRLHLDVATIGRALNGRLKTAGGFKWKYVNKTSNGKISDSSKSE